MNVYVPHGKQGGLLPRQRVRPVHTLTFKILLRFTSTQEIKHNEVSY
jgi:hypothetical protein